MRRFFAADLTAAIASTLPAELLPIRNSITVRLTNAGDTAAIGSVDTTLLFNAAADPSTTTFLTPAHAIRRINLAPQKSLLVKLVFDVPAQLTEGTYTLRAEADHNNTLVEGDETNNVSAGAEVIVHPPFVDLTVDSIGNPPPKPIAINSKTRPFGLPLKLKNSGNVAVARKATSVSLFATPNTGIGDGDDTLVGTINFKSLTIGAGKTKPLRGIIKLPSTMPSGNYFLIASADSLNNVIERDDTNNARTTATQLVAVNPLISGKAIVALGDIGIADGQAETIDFGSTFQGFAAPAQTFTVINSGDYPLTLGTISLPAGFVLEDGLASSLPPLESDSFTVHVNTTTPGLFTGSIAFVTNDPARNPFNFPVVASVIIPATPTLDFQLTTDTQRLIVGEPDSARFTAHVAATNSSTSVRLDEIDPAGNVIGTADDLFDDGNPLHGDVTAGDGIFNNTIAVTFDAVGERRYRATVIGGGAAPGQQTDPVTIAGIIAPSEAAVQASADDSTAITQQATAAITAGQSDSQILDGIRAHLLGEPAQVQPESIKTSGTVIAWTTVDGIDAAIDLYSLRLLAQAGPLETPSLAEAASVSHGHDFVTSVAAHDNECKHALVLDPFPTLVGTPGAEREGLGLFKYLFGFGYDVNYFAKNRAGGIDTDQFFNMSNYDTIAIISLGNIVPGKGLVIDSSDSFFLGYRLQLLIRGYFTIFNGHLGITSSFISKFAGRFPETIVYVDTPSSAANAFSRNSMPDAFIKNGAKDYIGYSDVHSPQFGVTQGFKTYETLLKAPQPPPAKPGNAVIDIPTLYEAKDPVSGATLTDYGDNTAGIPLLSCPNLNDHNLYIQYSWPRTSRDLDTNTQFLGVTSGFGGDNNSPYVTWSGDNTSGGGKESATIDLLKAYTDGKWTSTVDALVHAGWYQPSGGTGAATVHVALKNKITGAYTRSSILTVSPGRQDGLATTLVKTVQIKLTDPNFLFFEYSL